MRTALLIATLMVSLSVGCGSGTGDGNAAPEPVDAQESRDRPALDPPASTAAPSSTTSTTTTTSTTMPPPEPVVGFCNSQTMEQRWFSQATGDLLAKTSGIDLTVYPDNGIYVGDSGGWFPLEACGATSIAVGEGIPPREYYSKGFTELIAVQDMGDSHGVVAIDMLDGSFRPLVQPAVASDFGDGPADAQSAAFTGDFEGIIWRESREGQCETFIAPYTQGQIIARDAVAGFKVADGGACYNQTSYHFLHVGDEIVVCNDSSFLGCEDLSGNEYDYDEPEPNPVPDSPRFDLTDSLLASNGQLYFVGRDWDTRSNFAFAWGGEGTEPVQLEELGEGYWYPLGESSSDLVAQ